MEAFGAISAFLPMPRVRPGEPKSNSYVKQACARAIFWRGALGDSPRGEGYWTGRGVGPSGPFRALKNI